MEIAGLVVGGVGLIGIYGACIEIIERIESYKNVTAEARPLLAEFEVNKVILTKWASRVGLSKQGLTSSHDPRLDEPDVANAVSQVLSCIRSILVGTTPLRSALEGGSQTQASNDASGSVRDAMRKRDRLGWTFGGKQKFATQINLLGVFVEKLNLLIPDLGDNPNRLVRRDTSSLEHIPPIEMLQRVLQRIEAARDQENSTTILKAWIAQLTMNDPVLLQLAQYRVREAADKSSKHLIWEILDLIIRTTTVVLIVDGLDEYHYSVHGGNDSRVEFLATLKQFVANTRTYILVVSRDEVDIRSELSPRSRTLDLNYYEHQVTKENLTEDILAFSKSITETRLANKSQEVQHEIAEKMAVKCEGMFLWIDLQQRNLRGGKNKRQLDKIIDELPVNLESLYERDWQELQEREPHDRDRALNILRWAICGLRPLTIAEITEALAVADNDDDDDDLVDALPDIIDDEYVDGELLALCGSFIELRASSADTSLKAKTIHLKHFSVKQFLTANAAVCEALGATTANGAGITLRNYQLTRDCLRYLHSKSVQSPSESGFDKDFFDYAVWAWPKHLPYTYDKDLAEHIKKLFSPGAEIWRMWQMRYEELWRVEYLDNVNEDEDSDSEAEDDRPSQPYYLASFGLQDELQQFIAKDATLIDEVGGTYGNPIKAACIEGHSELVSLLIDLGAKLDTCHGTFGTLLGAAAWREDLQICKKLLELKVDVNKSDGQGETPLYHAVENENIEIVKLLLDHGADPLVAQEDGYSPLAISSSKGNIEIVRLLLSKSPEIDKASNNGLTALHRAAQGGFLAIVRLLLDSSASISAVDVGGRTALIHACCDSSLEVCQLLLDRGADIEACDTDGWRAIHYASGRGWAAGVELFLKRGAEACSLTEDGYTPAIIACYEKDVEVLRLLTQHGAELGVVGKDGYTGLIIASGNGHLSMVEFLLENGVDLTQHTVETGNHCLISAAANGRNDVIRTLIAHGVDLATRNASGFSALHMAAFTEHADTVALLIECGAPVNDLTEGESPRTAIKLAASKGYYEVVKELFDRGADPEINPNEGLAALCSAACYGHLPVVEYLVDHGAEINVTYGVSPISGAALNGELEIARYLLEHGADISVQEKRGRTCLPGTVADGSIEMVQLLLDHNANVNAQDDIEDHALKNAALHGYVEIVRLLLSHGADVSLPAAGGLTALIAACKNGHLATARLLLEHGATFTRERNNGTPLALAMANNHTEVAKLLLDHKAPVNEPSCNGWTPLHFAADTGNAELLEILLPLGADIKALTQRSETCLHLACRQDNPHMVRLLLDAGCDRSLLNNWGWSAYDSATQGLPEMSAQDLWGDSPGASNPTARQHRMRECLLDWIREFDKGQDIIYYQLGRLLLQLGDDENAKLAFEKRTSITEDGVTHPATCNKCDGNQNITTVSRYICRSCDNCDLCENCYATFRDEELTWRCQKHEFLQIAGTEALRARLADSNSANAVKEWLEVLRSKFSDAQ